MAIKSNIIIDQGSEYTVTVDLTRTMTAGMATEGP